MGVQASAELRGAPLPEWLTFDPDTMEFEALGNAQLDAPMQVDLVFGQYRLSVLVLPEELERSNLLDPHHQADDPTANVYRCDDHQ